MLVGWFDAHVIHSHPPRTKCLHRSVRRMSDSDEDAVRRSSAL